MPFKLTKTNLSTQLTFMFAVFVIGFALQFYLHYTVESVIGDVNKKIENAIIQGELGDKVTRNIREIEINYYQLFSITHPKKRRLILNNIAKKIAHINNVMTLLNKGGQFESQTDLNLPDKKT